MLLALIGLSFAVLGCGGSRKAQPAAEAFYPVRADWLVKEAPGGGGQPSKMYEPGYPPLTLLNRPHDTLSGDAALLVQQVRNRVILDTRKVEPDVREEFGKVLTELFGTPGDPHVPSGETLIDGLKLGDKLGEMRQALEEKRKELANLRTTAKGPDDQQAVGIIEMQVKAQEAELANLDQQIADLRAYENDLKLDPATLKKGGSVYRNYCQQCHGLSGDGNGPGAKYLIPMPRDYRRGLFKFTNSDPGLGAKRKPLRDDLRHVVLHGIDGSPMPQFAALKPDEIEAVVSYVIHLSLRGEAEYEVMKKAADPGGEGLEREDVRKQLVEQAADAAPRWLASARKPIVPDPDPYVTDEQKLDAAANGYRLFTSPEVGCATCHTGYGRSAPFQFDSWGTIVRPRNLLVATLRGGRSPEAIYARIYGGILGSNMPAHTHLKPTEAEKEKGTDKIWDLVHFVQFAGESAKRQLLRDNYGIEIE